MCKIGFTLFLLLLLFPLYGYSGSIQVKVVDERSMPVSFCDVAVKGKWHVLTDENGVVEIQAERCSPGDTILIHCLGYKDFVILVSSKFLVCENQRIQLMPEDFEMDEVVVQGKFNAERFFKDKKQAMIIPYTDKHEVGIIARIGYVDALGTSQNVLGKMKVLFHLKEPQIIESECTIDTALQAQIIRSLQLASYIPYSFCLKKFRKLHRVDYLGFNDEKWNFKFDVLPENVTHPFFGFQKGDQCPTLVSVDKNGFISSIETHTIVRSGMSRSYNLYVDYICFKSRMVPTYINATLIEDKMNIELWCKYSFTLKKDIPN